MDLMNAMAIAMALNDPAYEIVMISTVSGNVHVDQATINTLTTIEYADTYEPPVYKGSDKMLLKELIYAHETHGNDGMGDIGLVPKRLKAQEGHGVLKMLEHLRNSEREKSTSSLSGLLQILRLPSVSIMKQCKRQDASSSWELPDWAQEM